MEFRIKAGERKYPVYHEVLQHLNFTVFLGIGWWEALEKLREEYHFTSEEMAERDLAFVMFAIDGADFRGTLSWDPETDTGEEVTVRLYLVSVDKTTISLRATIIRTNGEEEMILDFYYTIMCVRLSSILAEKGRPRTIPEDIREAFETLPRAVQR